MVTTLRNKVAVIAAYIPADVISQLI